MVHVASIVPEKKSTGLYACGAPSQALPMGSLGSAPRDPNRDRPRGVVMSKKVAVRGRKYRKRPQIREERLDPWKAIQTLFAVVRFILWWICIHDR
jgi:hypothetical protein